MTSTPHAPTESARGWRPPERALRYDRDEFVAMVEQAGFEPQFIHSEEACHSGRFRG